jgi:membrane dipeptidase
MKIFDLHQDLMLHMTAREKYRQNLQTSWEMLEHSPIELVVATAFPDPVSGDQTDPSVVEMISEDIHRYNAFVNKNSEVWTLVREAATLSDKRKKILIHIEGLNVFSGSDEDWKQLELWHENGLRSLGLWWNIGNKLGGGTNSPTEHLTSLGADVVSWIEKKSIVLDMAHAGRATFFDVALRSNRPLYVSHGNADALCPSVRNYTDEQLRLIAHSGGVIGVFFANTFTTGKEKKGSINDVVQHILYIKKLIGIEHIAFGSDFGGIVSGTLEGLDSVDDLDVLIQTLKKSGLNEQEIEAITYKNAERVLASHLGC